MNATRRGMRTGSLVLRGLITAVFVLAAGMKFAAVPFEVSGFLRFGYPLWFMYAVGAAQLAGAALLWIRGATALGAFLLAAIMAGAVGSHLRAGDPLPMALPALVLLVLLAGLTWSRRHELVAPRPRVAAERA
ncbi:DoxX family protein [Methylobacterium sp. 4-46]|uniref:DoxX family protein n=1 Tax=unclassified Methylobacterium TaxID=2615210 RepID=UPI000152CD78|nr:MULTISPECIES: DoxX family protein [Methylobacterium]ACA19422.1 DoxX family protein [Methylobacterium sp. 4-46]WFT78621.1 DoxX family protein [Methylobacterium nodulans]